LLKKITPAFKFPSLLRILPPLLTGMAMGYGNSSVLHWDIITLTLLYAWLIQLFIVLLNDYADRDADLIHYQNYPHLLDRRVLVMKTVSPGLILILGMSAAVLLAGISFFMQIYVQRARALFITGLSLCCFLFYSFPPLKLNYRGLGELLETTGVGFLLPVTGYYFYTGNFALNDFIIIPVIMTAAANALASGLKHRPADKLTGKKTIAVLCGEQTTKNIILLLLSILVCYNTVLIFYTDLGLIYLLAGVIIPAGLTFKMFTLNKKAGVNNLQALKKYKKALTCIMLSICSGLVLQIIC